MRILFIVLASLLLSACATLPPAFNAADIQDISYIQVSEDIEPYKKMRVRWGGVIVDIQHEDSGSLMEVRYYPLDYYGRPEVDQPNEGRFLIKSEALLDMEEYAADREVVVVGVIEGKREPSISHGSTGLPLIHSTSIHLWPIAYRNNYFRHCPSCYFRQLFW